MLIFQKIALMVLVTLVLTGCEEKITYSYLMQHPNELKKAILDCQRNGANTEEQARQCEMVMYAANNMLSIITEQQADPEKFGQRIMETQLAFVKANDQLQQATQTLTALQTKKASATDLAKAEDNVATAKKTVEAKQKEIDVMLAVLSMSSPE